MVDSLYTPKPKLKKVPKVVTPRAIVSPTIADRQDLATPGSSKPDTNKFGASTKASFDAAGEDRQMQAIAGPQMDADAQKASANNMRNIYMGNTTGMQRFWDRNGQSIQNGIRDIAPYASNIANAFASAPPPPPVRSYNPVVLKKVNFGAAKAEADREVLGANQGISKYLPESEATAVRTGNLLQGIRAKNAVTMQEENANTSIANNATSMNSQIDMANIDKDTAWDEANLNRTMLNHTEHMGNLANAADKFTMMNNENAKMNLEKSKFDILAKMYSPSGVVNRLNNSLDIDPVTGQAKQYKLGGTMKSKLRSVYGVGGSLVKYADGGSIHIDPSKKGTFTAEASKMHMGVQEAASHILANKDEYSSAMVKKANFAHNAAAWKHAMGGELGGGDSTTTAGPGDPQSQPQPRYTAGAKLAYYKEILNNKLREKDPTGYDNFFAGRLDYLKKNDQKGLEQYDQTAPFNTYLSPDEIKKSLGNNYDDYLQSVHQASEFIPGQTRKQLYGSLEDTNNPAALNYGRRFASLATLTSQDDTQSGIRTEYAYNPKTGVKVVRSRFK